jgi:hypothetical protein
LVNQGASDVSARKGFEDHVSDLVLEIWNATAFPWREGLWHLSAASGRRHPKHLHEADRAGESDMPYATTDDGVRLETGSDHPLILVHEFAGDLRSFEPQMRISENVTAPLPSTRVAFRRRTYRSMSPPTRRRAPRPAPQAANQLRCPPSIVRCRRLVDPFRFRSPAQTGWAHDEGQVASASDLPSLLWNLICPRPSNLNVVHSIVEN